MQFLRTWGSKFSCTDTGDCLIFKSEALLNKLDKLIGRALFCQRSYMIVPDHEQGEKVPLTFSSCVVTSCMLKNGLFKSSTYHP